MDHYELYKVEAKSFEGRIPLRHEFTMPGKSEEEVLEAVQNRWPELYEIRIIRMI